MNWKDESLAFLDTPGARQASKRMSAVSASGAIKGTIFLATSYVHSQSVKIGASTFSTLRTGQACAASSSLRRCFYPVGPERES